MTPGATPGANTVRLADLTTEEAGPAIATAEVALLPVGAVEQHGPHLSLLTDARVAEEFAARLGAELGPAAVVCPLVPYGLSEHHEAFAGTLTLTPTTYLALLHDLVASLAQQGLRKIVIVNGHGGNVEALTLVTRRARSELGIAVASMMWAKLARDVCAEEATGRAFGHACELETSLAMVLAPDVVRAERIVAPKARPEVESLAAPPRAFVDVAVRFDELTTDGVYGDPTKASTRIGERILATALDRAAAFTRAFAEQ